jgi:hypothetical protein
LEKAVRRAIWEPKVSAPAMVTFLIFIMTNPPIQYLIKNSIKYTEILI